MKKSVYVLALLMTICSATVFAQTCNVNAGTISANRPPSFCGGDGIPDVVTVTVTGAVGANHRIIYENGSGIIYAIQEGSTIDFEGWPSTVLNARGISYENGLQGLTVGSSVNNLSGCFALSTTGFTITVFNNEAGSITTQGNTAVSICVTNGQADILPISYSGFDAFGIMFAITDTNDNIISLHQSIPNLEGTGVGVVRLRIITSCRETFEIPVGTNINSLPSHMDISNAITVTKTSCSAPVCAPEVKSCPGKVLMCVNGVSTCVDQKQVSKLLRQGATRGGCIVCTTTTARQATTERAAEELATVYPNPSNGSFSINSVAKGNVNYAIYNSSGNVVWSKNIRQTAAESTQGLTPDNLDLKDGIYYMRISLDKVTQTKRLVIKREK